MQDFKTTLDFRKGFRYSKLAEDPTYLTFFFMFDYYSEESPLFNGEAVSYLKNVVKDTERATALENFIKILQRVNSELPWFWQSVTGVETVQQYGNLAEPWRGAEKPAIEISCLETVELTVSGMIDLYKRAAYDFERWVEVIPKNLRRFRMWVWVSEVRDFSRSSASKAFSALQQARGNNVVSNDNSVKSAKPFFQIELAHCTWDIDSTSNIFADLSRSPGEVSTPTIKIFYERAKHNGEYGNNSLPNANRTLGEMLGEVAREKLDRIASGAIDRATESLQARALLGNVHGLNLASTIQDAFSAGSVNGIANILNGVNTTGSGDNGGGNLGEVHDKVPQKSTIPNGNVYGRIPQDSEDFNSENVHSGSNVVDNEGPINQNVHK
jgi:hypothetical protein